MMNRRKTNVSVGMGGTLIVTVFMVLCLMIFAALSFTTAYSDLKLSNKVQEITLDYYSIQGKAEEKLSEISDVLFDINTKALEDCLIEKLSSIEGITLQNAEKASLSSNEEVSLIHNDNLLVQYEVLGERNQKISVELNILGDSNKYYYEIVAWNLSNIELPVYQDEIIDIWEGL